MFGNWGVLGVPAWVPACGCAAPPQLETDFHIHEEFCLRAAPGPQSHGNEQEGPGVGRESRRPPVLAHAVHSPCHPADGDRTFLGHRASRNINDILDGVRFKTSRELLGSAASPIGGFFGVGILFPQMPGGVCGESHVVTPVTAAGKEKTQNPPLLGVLNHLKIGLFLYNFKTLENLVGH